MRSCVLLAAVCACVSVLCATVGVGAVDPAFPAIPDAYSAVVSINYASLNFTLAWMESWYNTHTTDAHRGDNRQTRL